jgi:type IV secretion system protein VirB11
MVKALENDDVVEICANSDGSVWIEEKTNRMYDSGVTISPENLVAALGTIAAMNGSELNESNPIVECRIPFNGSRVAGSIPPVSREGP